MTVAGKTGSLSGKNPDGRYEWFIGVAPAESPRVAIAAVVVQRPRYWRTASQVAAGVLESVFCERGAAMRPARTALPRPRSRKPWPGLSRGADPARAAAKKRHSS